ncbi:MAG TPA: hypothetical protein VNA20_04615 [Frankiaceae bacterium]|nr:hypothetical protein [Frankiaceae bacterium]
MSSSRARTRVAALVAVIPVFVAAGPLVTPAVAADPFVVSNLIQEGQVVGPNAGYLGLGIGQTGSTAMFKVTAPDTTSTISSVELTLTQIDNAFSWQYQSELDAADGLALYADANTSGTFDAADKAAGNKASGYGLARTPTETEVSLKLSFATPASGATTYFLAIHPKSNPVTSGRRFTFRVEPGGIATSNGNAPVQAVSTPPKTDAADPRMRVDSAAPAEPARSHFTAKPQPAGTEDYYDVSVAAAAGDANAKILFFNHEQNTASTAVLRRPGFNPAVVPDAQIEHLALDSIVNGAATEKTVKIGDGTGVLPDQAILAKNNQINNAVYARVADSVGNLSVPAILSDCFQVPNQTNEALCETARGNPVVAPATPIRAEMAENTTDIVAINLSHHRAVPLEINPEINSTKPRTSRTGTAAANANTNADKYSRAATITAMIAQVLPAGGVDSAHTTALSSKPAPQSSATSTAAIVTFHKDDGTGIDTIASETVPRGIQEGQKIATVVAVAKDRYDNASVPKTSLTPYTKDITAPTLAVQVDDPTLAKGEPVRMSFSEPMIIADIESTNVACSESTSRGWSAEQKLDVRTPDGTDRTWGMNFCFTWHAGNSTATLTLGDPALRLGADGMPMSLPSLGDYVAFGTQIRDVNENQISGLGLAPHYTTITLPSARPLVGETRDNNRDGKLDAVDVSFTTGLNLSTVEAAKSNLSAVGATQTVPITGVTLVTSIEEKPTYRFHFASDFGTDQTPSIRLVKAPGAANTALKDVNGDFVAEFNSLAPRDKAFPVPVRAVTVDADATTGKPDGKLDRIVLTYSEGIVHSADNNPAETNLTAKAYDVTGYEGQDPVNPNRKYNEVTPGNGSTDQTPTKTITLAPPESAPYDTGVTPMVNFTKFTQLGSPARAPKDAAGNVWLTTVVDGLERFHVTPADGAAPFIVSRTTADANLNGLVDAVDIVFSESLPTRAVGAQFTVTGRNIVRQEDLGTTGVRLVIAEATDTTGDTSSRPTVQYLGGVTDLVNNPLAPETAPVQTTDGAGPAIVGACAQWATGINGSCPVDDAAATDDGTKINVFLSEPVATTTVESGDFAVEQSVAKPVTGVTPIGAVNSAASSFTLSFALNAINATEDFVVKFSGADKVDDMATPAVKNKQTGTVTGLGGPVATMELECSVETDDPEFCSSTTVNTGIESSASVIGWRLKNTARGALVEPSDYVSTKPGVITLVEGTHTLFLSGIDKFGRLSNPEATDKMTVLTPPRIPTGSVKMANSNSAATKSNQWSRINTVRDGDVLKITADAFGADAAEWAEGSAATGGGCLADHMAINLRGVTANPADTKRAPIRCDSTIATETPGRQMVFPSASVRRTTRYPVGSVVKFTSTDPGALIVDGPNGTVARRHFISNAARRSWMISDASVVTVPRALVSALPRQANLGYRDGAILKASTGALYYVERGVKRPVSAARLKYWRISTTTAYAVSATELRSIPTGKLIGSTRHADGTWIKYNDGRIYQIVKNAQGVSVRRKLASYSALRTRVPSTHVYAANLADNHVPIDNNWLIGYRDGVMLRFGTTNPTFGVIARGSLRMFANTQTFNSLGFNAANAILANTAAIPRVSGETYRTGTAIDRYKIDSVVITVTNKVGAATTATVLPAYGGLFGIGTIDPRPAGWDSTR